MAASAREFFAGVAARVDVARTQGVTATYRFDIDGAGSWHVAVAGGSAAVAESGEEADCVIRMREDVFLELVRGERKPTAAFMTGKLKVEGGPGPAPRLQPA